MANRLESLLDAIASLKGFHNPDSYTYQIKNPLLIHSFARPGKHTTDAEGRRIFTSWLAGYKACLFDLEMKVSCRSSAGLTNRDKLSGLLRIYGLPDGLGHDQVVKFLRRAIKDQTITKDIALEYFRD